MALSDWERIAWFCLACVAAMLGIFFGQYQARTERTFCAATLADGRTLQTTYLSHAGHTKCVYHAPQGSIAARKYRNG